MKTTSGKRVLAAVMAVVICLGAGACKRGEIGGNPPSSEEQARGALSEGDEPVAEKDAGVGGETIPLERWKVFLIGVNEYDDPDIDDLSLACADVDAFRDRLADAGVPDANITVLETCDDPEREPRRETIEKEYRQFCDGLQSGELALVLFSGHGVQPNPSGSAYFCPQDVRPDDIEGSCVSVNELMTRLLASDASVRWMIADACRNAPGGGSERGGLPGSNLIFIKAQGTISLWQSCSEGETSLESPAFGHGLFVQSILEGFGRESSPAAGKNAGTLRMHRFFEYVSGRVSELAAKYGGKQTPQFTGQTNNIVLLADLTVDGATLAERNRAEDHYLGAVNLYNDGSYAEALQEVELATSFWKGPGGRFEDLQKRIRTEVNREEGTARYQEAQRLFKSGEYLEAEVAVGEALELCPDHYDFLALQKELRRHTDVLKGRESFLKGLTSLYGLEGAREDRREAVKYFEQSASEGSLRAKGMLALLAYEGAAGEGRDLAKAYRLATEEGVVEASPEANEVLCCFRRYGIEDVAMDFDKAEEYYNSAMYGYQTLVAQGEPGAELEAAIFQTKSSNRTVEDNSRIWTVVLKHAENGCAKAMGLAGRYLAGKATFENLGLSVDQETAFKWAQEGAEHNDGDAMGLLATLYAEGNVVKSDKEKAETWFKRGIEEGSMFSEKVYAEMLCAGDKPSRETGLKVMTQAAEKGDCQAMLWLGAYYLKGEKKDPNKGLDWFGKAVLAGSVEGMVVLGNQFLTGIDLEQDVVLGTEMLYRAEQNGCVVGNLGLCVYYLEHGTQPEHFLEAVRLADNAYNGGINFAPYYAGSACAKLKRYEDAVEWYRKGTELKDKESIRALGLAYKRGRGVEQDYAKAAELFEEDSSLGFVPAMLDLAECYEHGYGVEPSREKRSEWLLKAAKGGNVKAMHLISECFRLGDGVEHDADEWRKWRDKAAEAGYKPVD